MDYKVNFKTKTMEWKTKYNNLVNDFNDFKENSLKPKYVGTVKSLELVGYNTFVFSFPNGVENGIYLFTYGNCMVLLPIYNLVKGQEYKISMTFRKSDGGVSNGVLTYKIDSHNNYLYLYNKDNNFIPVNYDGYLFMIKLN